MSLTKAKNTRTPRINITPHTLTWSRLLFSKTSVANRFLITSQQSETFHAINMHPAEHGNRSSMRSNGVMLYAESFSHWKLAGVLSFVCAFAIRLRFFHSHACVCFSDNRIRCICRRGGAWTNDGGWIGARESVGVGGNNPVECPMGMKIFPHDICPYIKITYTQFNIAFVRCAPYRRQPAIPKNRYASAIPFNGQWLVYCWHIGNRKYKRHPHVCAPRLAVQSRHPPFRCRCRMYNSKISYWCFRPERPHQCMCETEPLSHGLCAVYGNS